MRKIAFILSLALIGCSKEWNCTTTGTYNGVSINTHSTFHGTKQAKEDYEDKNTSSFAVTECN